MKIIEDTKPTSETTVIKVTKACYLGDYKIGIEFSDGTYQEVNFKPFLSNSHHPEIRKFLDEKLFTQFEVKDGNLNWNDFDLIFPVWDLYQGEIT